MKINKEIIFLLEFIKINFKSSLSLRGAFFLRLIFVMINNIIFFVSWYIFFLKFKVINGWTFYHVSLMYGIVNVSLGVNSCCFNGLKTMPRFIEQGELDIFFALPRSVLMSIASCRTEHSGIGVIISGLFLIYLSEINNYDDVFLVFLFIINSVVVFASINIVFGSLSFWFKDLNRLSLDLFNVVVMLSTNPNCVYRGLLKIIIFTIIPVGFVSYLPVEYFVNRKTSYIFIICSSSLLFFSIALSIFRLGLKRYESGSSIIMTNKA